MHFSQAHRELRETGELDMRDTIFNTANLVQEVIEGVQQVLHPAMEASYEAEAADILHHANAAPAASTQQTALMEQIQHMMQLMQQQLQQSSSGHSNNKSNKIRTKTDKNCLLYFRYGCLMII